MSNYWNKYVKSYSGENAVSDFLTSHHFQGVITPTNGKLMSTNRWFIHSYKPTWLNNLHLDFFVHYENIVVGIEFDGRQHFSCDKHFYHNNYASYEYSRERDRRKDMLCTINGLPLIRLEDIGDLISTSPLIAKSILDRALIHGLSRALYLQKHSHICGVIKEPISWYNAYYSAQFKNTVIQECLVNAKSLKRGSKKLKVDIKKLVATNYSRKENIVIAQDANYLILLIKSTVAKLGVLKPKLEASLVAIQDDIIMGIMQFYTHPQIYFQKNLNQKSTNTFKKYNNNGKNLSAFSNIHDENTTCEMIKQFAKQTIQDVIMVKRNNLD